MKVLAIDPGSVNAGYALCMQDGRKLRYLASGVLRFNSKEDFLSRIKFIYEEALRLIEEFQPDEIALEGLIFVKSPTALIKLAQARGAMLAALTQTGKPIFEYAPSAVKATVSGHGAADKEALQKFLRLHLGPVEFKTHDESDAIAIAFCHLMQRSSPIAQRALQISGKKKRSGGKGLAASLAHKTKEISA